MARQRGNRLGYFKKMNEYAESVGPKFYERCPKAVFAAIAVSALTNGGDKLREADRRVLKEWWILYHAGVVTQKPIHAEPSDDYGIGHDPEDFPA